MTKPATCDVNTAAEVPGDSDGSHDALVGNYVGQSRDTMNAKTLANRRKKDKRKAKQELEKSVVTVPGQAEAAISITCPRARGSAIRAAQQRIAAQRKVEEERQEFEKEQQRLIEEERCRLLKELRQAEEEIARAEAERSQKRSSKQASVGKKKANGTHLTKKQKAQQARAAQFIEFINAQGVQKPESPNVDAKTGRLNDILDADTDADTDLENTSVGDRCDGFAHTCSYRCPVVCVMGHVDAGKTSLLDTIRKTSVQQKETGGITQQIGATMLPKTTLLDQTSKIESSYAIHVPGLLVIDTPGHETFNNLRLRGSSLCDAAVVVIDIKKGIEQQTKESLQMLMGRDCRFVIALNKLDRLYGWKNVPNVTLQMALEQQEEYVIDEFETLLQQRILELNEHGLNCAMPWANEDLETTVSLVPASAVTGAGVAELLFEIVKLSQTVMPDRLKLEKELQCTVMEVRSIDNYGATVDVLLRNGTLQEGDKIVLAGSRGPIVTTVKCLLTPQPLKEMRAKDKYLSHRIINTSCCVRICASGCEHAIAGSQLCICGSDSNVEELMSKVQAGVPDTIAAIEREATGIYVKASEVGKLEALLQLLQGINIPVFDVGIGEIQQKDVRRAAIMKEKGFPECAVILAFDVKLSADAKSQALRDGVNIISSSSIFEIFDQIQQHMELAERSKQDQMVDEAVFPVILEIQHVFRQRLQLMLDCKVLDGQLRVGTPLCIPDRKAIPLGDANSIHNGDQMVSSARRGDQIRVVLDQTDLPVTGEHIAEGDLICSEITKRSIEALKATFKDVLRKDDWRLLNELKQLLKVH